MIWLAHQGIGIISGITLVLLPCFTTVSVPSFLNNSNNGSLIGDIIMNQGSSGLSSPVALARTSVLVLIVGAISLALYAMIVYFPKLVNVIRKRWNK